MWILRFHLLKPKDYNKLSRICKKYGFVPRQISPVVFAKSLILHKTQKKSWRMVARELGVSHVALYKFSELSRHGAMLEEIFHVFIDRRIALYIGDKKHISSEYLDNSMEILELTKRQVKSML